ncbi:hypothetical protein HDU76_007218 [Blyttiomyces sp. JEL0837]|nr:hypothetical protein HDU76_007218 [Blyttiomyces sp. JEL0837]
MSLLWRFTKIPIITGAALTGLWIYYTHQIKSTTRISETPSTFQTKLRSSATQKLLLYPSSKSLFNGQHQSPTWGYYERMIDLNGHLDYAFKGSDAKQGKDDMNASDSLTAFIRSVFTSKAYTLERMMTSIEQDGSTFQPKVNSSYGHLKVTDLPSSHEAFLRYEHDEIDFILYFNVSVAENKLTMGFIELRGDVFEDLGSRVYVPVLLESAIRKLIRERVQLSI